MLGWRDGGRTRWWQWPARVATAVLQGVRTAAAREDMDKLPFPVPLLGDQGPATPAPLDPAP
ncbi:MAG TPA: hypothetical protein VKU91_10165 [Acidimicrobiales bacterium]|nr:hypothetical protein [Acidimicrobiales bacterium]